MLNMRKLCEFAYFYAFFLNKWLFSIWSLGEYRSDRSEIWRDDALGYLQQIYLGDKGLVDFPPFP